MPTGPSRRQLILETALDLFAERGYDGTPVGDIADRLAISKSAISYHFPSKEDLLVTLADPYFAAVDELLGQHAGPLSSTELRTLVVAYFDLLIANRRLAIWLDTDHAISRHQATASRRREIRQRLTAAITAGNRDKRDRARALALLGGLWRPLRLLDDSTLDDVKDEIVAAALASYQSDTNH